jgi:pentatricopeptide repeat protein
VYRCCLERIFQKLNSGWVGREMQTRASYADRSDDTPIGTSYPVRRPRRGRVVIGSDDDIRDLCLNGQPKNSLHILEQRGIDPSSYAYVCLLRRCTNIKDLAEGKYVHAHMANSDFVPSTFVLNALLNMYMKCGSLRDARQVFDRMQERDMFTWTMMLTGYAKLGHPEEAYKIYEQMQKERVPVDRITFTTIFSICASLRSLEKGRKVHQDMIRAGICPDIILGNTVIDMYAKCGNVMQGHKVFKEMSDRDVVTWNIMISGAAQNGYFDEAFGFFEAMRDEGQKPDKVTYVCILNACSSLEQGRILHSDIVKAGFELDVRVGTSLVNMFSKCGSVEDALQVFEKLPQRNVVSWTSVIAAYAQIGKFEKSLEYYEKMLKEGILPDKLAYTTVLNVCATLEDLERGQQVRDHMVKSGISTDIFVENTLIHMYCKCGRMEDAHQLLQNMKGRDVVSYTALIGGCVQHGQFQEALNVFDNMQREGVLPNSATFLAVLKACAGLGSLAEGRRIHASIVEAGLSEDTNIKHALADMYTRCDSCSDAQGVSRISA